MSPEDEALSAAAHWGALAAPPRLVAARENRVYELRLADGRRAALRLHRAGYQTDAAIRSELAWCEGLARAGFPCPAPIRTEAGALLAPSRPRASLVSWIDAPPIGSQSGGATQSPAAQARVYRDLGALIARLHQLGDSLPRPRGFTRPRWNRAAFTSDRPLWGRYWENPELEAREAALLQAARGALDHLLAVESDIGLIHADLLQENVLGRAGALSIIDFDDSGIGFRGYDLGTALIQHAGSRRYERLRDALLEGYASRRRPPAGIDRWVLLRALASCGWIVPRAGPDDPRMAYYARRATDLARAWLASL